MSAPRHTPGPWEARAGSLRHRHWLVDAPGRRFVAQIDGPPDDEGEANARLIAAAPELLEALQGVLEGLPFDGTESEYELVQAGCTPTEAAQLAKAFAAIARATGAA